MLNNIVLFLLINIITVLFFWWDKRSAKHGGWRIPESSLLMVSLMGGSIAAFFAMRFFRHKTSKASFQIKFWFVVIAQVVGALWFFIHK